MMNIRHVPAVTDAAPNIVNRKQNIKVQVSQYMERTLNKTAKSFKETLASSEIQNFHPWNLGLKIIAGQHIQPRLYCQAG